MLNNREYYYLGRPIDSETMLGKIRFLTIEEYVDNLPELSLISLNVIHVYYQYKKQNVNNDSELNEALEQLKKESLFSVVLSNKAFLDSYLKIFDLVIENKDELETIFKEESLFMKTRQLVMEMNFLREEEASPNPEIQRGIERSRRVKQQQHGDKTSFNDIATSIVVGSTTPIESLYKMTVFQFYSTYYRIAQFHTYNTSVLYSTVAEKVSVESWNKHIDLFEGESNVIDKDAFNKQFGGGF